MFLDTVHLLTKDPLRQLFAINNNLFADTESLALRRKPPSSICCDDHAKRGEPRLRREAG